MDALIDRLMNFEVHRLMDNVAELRKIISEKDGRIATLEKELVWYKSLSSDHDAEGV